MSAVPAAPASRQLPKNAAEQQSQHGYTEAIDQAVIVRSRDDDSVESEGDDAC